MIYQKSQPLLLTYLQAKSVVLLKGIPSGTHQQIQDTYHKNLFTIHVGKRKIIVVFFQNFKGSLIRILVEKPADFTS